MECQVFTYCATFHVISYHIQGPEPNSLAVGTFSGTPILIVGTRTGLLYTYTMRGVSATFESVHREGLINDIWGNLYSTDNAGDALISDIG